jgi:ABC-2 type transport system ATP-binding protein
LTWSVPTGSILRLPGPERLGKTTTIRLLLGMVRLRGGAISLLGEDVPARLPAALARTGYVPERPHLYPSLTVAEALRFHGAFYRTWDGAWAETLRARFELRPAQRVGRLSKGETGKLMILLFPGVAGAADPG